MVLSKIVIVDPVDSTLVLFTTDNEHLKSVIIAALQTAGFEYAEMPIGSGVKHFEQQQEPAPARVRTRSKSRVKRARKRVRCSECGELFSHLGIGPHMRIKHGKYIHGEPIKGGRSTSNKLSSAERKKECPVCFKEFDIQGLAKHIRYKHKKEAQKASAVAAKDKERIVLGITEQLLKDVATGLKEVPNTQIGQAVAVAAQKLVSH